MDSDGGIHSGQPLGVPAYKAPFALPVDPAKVKSALDQVSNVLKGRARSALRS